MKTAAHIHTSKIISISLLSLSVIVFSACFHQTQTSQSSSSQPEQSANVNSTIVTQEGLIATFPTADLPIIDRVEVTTSLRNETGEVGITHEAEYISNTSVSELYADYAHELERAGWTEQNPQTQQVGAIQMMSGTFVRDNDTISVAIQTSAGTNKDIGATTVFLKIEQVK